ncbi:MULTISPECIES: hypothetical protein [Streptomyces]|nr:MULTISPECIES: hypothetical protein [Streptomyces]
MQGDQGVGHGLDGGGAAGGGQEVAGAEAGAALLVADAGAVLMGRP